MEVGIKVIAEDIQTQTVRHANSCFFTMVAMDDARKPVPVTPLELLTPNQVRRDGAARIRRQLRQEFSKRLMAASSPA